MKIGIPRAFYYYSYPSLWETFFRELGMEPVISERSSRKTVETAALVTESEHCLPHKIFDGHLRELSEKVDAVFVPRVLSMVRDHICCAKFGALPDASRVSPAGRGIPILSFDINETRRPLRKALVDFAVKELGCKKKQGKAAAAKAFEAMDAAYDEETAATLALPETGRYLLLGHPYTLHDNFIADPILRKLRTLDVPVEIMSFRGDTIPRSPIRWCTFNKMYQKLLHLSPERYAGVIQISAFNCGADSTMLDAFRRVCRERGVPYLVLMVDEHSGQAGVETRLEAFVDSVQWKKKREEAKGAAHA